MVHVVYCDDKEKVLEKILDGSKTMVVRGAAGRKIPHSRVFENETLYFMKKGTAKISAKATVESVQNLVKLSEDEITSALEEPRLALSSKQKARWHKKCLCLVGFNDVTLIEPLDFDHQGNMDDWLIIEKIEDVVVGTSIPYNYEKSRFS
ncbi:MAG: hypothetical protein LIO58_00895 [Oscillospiraceae bacterium]|nr:hypothetical protein [Oscillospiraceae bacterium]